MGKRCDRTLALGILHISGYKRIRSRVVQIGVGRENGQIPPQPLPQIPTTHLYFAGVYDPLNYFQIELLPPTHPGTILKWNIYPSKSLYPYFILIYGLHALPRVIPRHIIFFL